MEHGIYLHLGQIMSVSSTLYRKENPSEADWGEVLGGDIFHLLYFTLSLIIYSLRLNLVV